MWVRSRGARLAAVVAAVAREGVVRDAAATDAVEGDASDEKSVDGPALELPPYKAPSVDGLHWSETFDGDVWSRWTPSAGEKYNGAWKVETRKEEALVGDLGLHIPAAAMHYGVSVDIPPVQLREGGPSFLLQFEAKHQDGLQCGGSYLKLFARGGAERGAFDGDTPYIIMFGPDRCGATDKVHFILRHQNPLNGTWEEKHLRDAPIVPNNKRTHLYGLLIRADNYFEVQVDGVAMVNGSLLERMEPPVNPPKEIDDPSDTKPEDWVDLRLIDDPESTKPDDWGDEDEPEGIPDPDATKPEGWNDDDAPLKVPDPDAHKPDDWDDDEDGEWEPQLVDNPACKVGCGHWEHPMIENPKFVGKWQPPLIDNPAFIGPWSPRKIDNPNYYFDGAPALFPAVDAIGFDIWTMQGGIMFDNLIVVLGDPGRAEVFANETWRLRKPIEEIQDPPDPEPPESWFGDGGLLGWMDRNPVAAAILSWTVLLILLFQCVCPGALPAVYRWCSGKRSAATEDAASPDAASSDAASGASATAAEPKQEKEKKDD